MIRVETEKIFANYNKEMNNMKNNDLLYYKK